MILCMLLFLKNSPKKIETKYICLVATLFVINQMSELMILSNSIPIHRNFIREHFVNPFLLEHCYF